MCMRLYFAGVPTFKNSSFYSPPFLKIKFQIFSEFAQKNGKILITFFHNFLITRQYFTTRSARYCGQKEGGVYENFIFSDWNRKQFLLVVRDYLMSILNPLPSINDGRLIDHVEIIDYRKSIIWVSQNNPKIGYFLLINRFYPKFSSASSCRSHFGATSFQLFAPGAYGRSPVAWYVFFSNFC